VEDGVVMVYCDLIVDGITNQALSVGEGNKGRSGAVAVISIYSSGKIPTRE
jgi:hypothetical protein